MPDESRDPMPSGAEEDRERNVPTELAAGPAPEAEEPGSAPETEAQGEPEIGPPEDLSATAEMPVAPELWPPSPEQADSGILQMPARSLAEVEVPKTPALVYLVRVIALPRSTFRLLAEEDIAVWPAALAVVFLASLTKAGVAVGFAARGAVPASAMPAVAVRYALALLGPPLFAATAAGFLLLAQRLWQGEAHFGTILSATSLTLMPIAIRDLAQAALMAVQGQVLLHPGFSALLAPPGDFLSDRIAYALLGPIDAFAIWTFALLVLSAGVTRGRGWVRGAIAAALFGVLFALVSAAPSFLISPLMPQ